jgi:hypothetical protein
MFGARCFSEPHACKAVQTISNQIKAREIGHGADMAAVTDRRYIYEDARPTGVSHSQLINSQLVLTENLSYGVRP